ncbi:hypothetical protein Tfer_1877 [Thermincola ferriacetica]|uniref:Uncharacterized protein n=1 Tax=Thermincola ferriacetica TaxID=281456 RepID=A0A0L6W1N7_9FIRM|nr:hypothetical protein [Thermincola ferriacetica]KNZ69435.1 hypothetical protein Tfer_1877 [Thermincola ferriacetica]
MNKAKVLKEINNRIEMYNLFIRAVKKAHMEKKLKASPQKRRG